MVESCRSTAQHSANRWPAILIRVVSAQIEVNKQAGEEIRYAIQGMNPSATYANASVWVADTLRKKSEDIFKNYRPTWDDTTIHLNQLFADIKGIPVTHWDNHPDSNKTLDNRMNNNINEFLYTIANSLFASFEIDPMREMVDQNQTRSKPQKEIYREIGVHYAAVVGAGPVFPPSW